MNNLFKHIEYLLLRHDCVIVPGLGAFIATMCPAKIDMDRGLIFPPSRMVMFNQAVTIDDGLLANSVSRKYNLPFEDARMVILREVDKIWASIRNLGSISCGALGSLTRGEEGNLIFSPVNTVENFSSLLGLAPVNIRHSFEKDIQDVNSDNEPKCDTKSPKQETVYYSFKIRKALIRMTAACFIVAAVAIAVLLNPIPHDEKEQRASVVPVEALIPAPAKVIEKDTAVQVVTDIIEEEKEPTHYLIVGTFSTQKEAEAYISLYSSDDFKMSPVASRKVCRVAVAASDDREELRKMLNTRDVKSKFPNAWIWSRN